MGLRIERAAIDIETYRFWAVAFAHDSGIVSTHSRVR
jgi:hypothetical protein